MKKNDLEYYDINADQWWQEGETLHLSYYLNKYRFDFFFQYIPNWQGLKVLDIGCGGGLACEFLAKQKANVSGIDVSFNSIKIAQEHAKLSQLKIDYHYGFAEELPFNPNTFDVVLCFDVLEHVNDWQKVILEAYRILKPHGLFLFDTINQTFKSKFIMIWLLEDMLRQIPRGFHDWDKFIKPRELINRMKTVGFEEIVLKGFDMIDNANLQTLTNILFQGLSSHHKSKNSELFEIKINDDTSVWYIGKAVKV
jgi:2-polyprenyl-6-hydroxyphenyl methylase/3-demethylubiquinone-9 3-methyltransferase